MHSLSMNAAASRAVAMVSATAKPIGAPTEVTTPSLNTGSSSPMPISFSPPAGMSATVMNALKSGIFLPEQFLEGLQRGGLACDEKIARAPASSSPSPRAARRPATGTSCVYCTSPEAWANAARLMIGLRHREKFGILGALLRPRATAVGRDDSPPTHSPAATCSGSTASATCRKNL